jgi:hypothetical protein
MQLFKKVAQNYIFISLEIPPLEKVESNYISIFTHFLTVNAY